MHFAPDWRLFLLIGAANAVPIIAKNMFGPRFAFPLDRHWNFRDGQRLLGSAKTWRGILLSLAVTALLSPGVGVGWRIGLLIAATAMAGDLLASFVKRRLGLPASAMAVGLDQIPESLFPMIACSFLYPLSLADIIGVVGTFLAAELVLSRFLYSIHVRDEPY